MQITQPIQNALRFLVDATALPPAGVPPATPPRPFRELDPDPSLARAHDPDVDPDAEEVDSIPKERRAVSLGRLLGNLDETFKAFELPTHEASWLPKYHLKAIQKLGVHVDYSGTFLVQNMRTVPPGKKLPALVSISFGMSRYDTRTRIHAVASIAVKEDKLPSNYQQIAGQHFLFGSAYRIGVKDADDPNQNLHWTAGYITVSPDGTVHIPRCQEAKTHTIPIKNPASRRHSGRSVTYTSHQWGSSPLTRMYMDPELKRAEAQAEAHIRMEFCMAMNWWMERETKWSVAVRKGKQRMTFCIPPDETKAFFKDRIKIQTASGRTRPIVHHVDEFERTLPDGSTTTVREHIRGLTEFAWKDYDCRVTAPKFNGHLSSGFDLAAATDDDTPEDAPTPAGWLNMEQVAAMLVDTEEAPRRRRKTGGRGSIR